jgi:ubiquinone/menaquinone biosynthesis C-methylase UbiE
VHSVDIADDRLEREGFEFHLVEGAQLPFEDSFFDIVLSNHVIEHVGDLPEQRTHLA